MQRDHVDPLGQFARVSRFGDGEVQERHTVEAELPGERARFFHQFAARLDAVDVPAFARAEEQVVDDEAEVRLARAVVGQRGLGAAARQFTQQLFNELEQVVHLLELAP